MRYLTPLKLQQLTKFGHGLLQILFEKLRLTALQRLESSLLHSIAVDGKIELLKKLMLSTK